MPLDSPPPDAEPAVALRPGEMALLLTDGIVEARGPCGAMFGADRALLHANSQALMFYARNGWLHADWDEDGSPDGTTVALSKRLDLGVAQTAQPVFIAAAAE